MTTDWESRHVKDTSECDSRLGVTSRKDTLECDSRLWMTSRERHPSGNYIIKFSGWSGKLWVFRKWSIYFPPFPSNPNVLLTEARHTLSTSRCTTAKVEPQMPLCISFTCTNPPNHWESRVERDPVLILITLVWHSHTWYPDLLCLSTKNPLLLPTI